MKVIEYRCQICESRYQAGKEHSDPKHCKICAEWLRALDMGPRQKGKKDYWRLGLVIAGLVREGKLGEDSFIKGFVAGIRR